jgi:hypothetical protein
MTTVATASPAGTKRLASAAVVGVACFVAAAAFLHAIQPDLSPVDDAVSYYMNGRLGWVLGAGLVLMGFGSLALLFALRRFLGAANARWGLRWLAVWAAGAIVGGIFPPDPRGHWGNPPSVSGLIHANVAMIAFLAFPIAALLLSGPIGQFVQARRKTRLRLLAYASVLSLLIFFICLAPVFSHHAPRYLGLVERIVLAAYVAWLAAAAFAVIGTVRTVP